MAKELKRSEYDMTELAEKIRLFREYLGLTSKAFGEGIGYSGSYISQLEHETRDIPENIVNLICNAYGVDVEYFAGNISLEDAT
ncbi:Helix-turn-helix domain-containing protein [Lachnospiraceae bacterium KH1T2]|nr:Helix-turn-helix domain-containing protein [Lachnospiraceae bacterium KH1T2]